MNKAMKRGGPPEEPEHPNGGDNDDHDHDNHYHEAFPATHAPGSDGKILGNLPSPFNGDRARRRIPDEHESLLQAQHQKLPTMIPHDPSRHVPKQHGRTRDRRMED
jgi:hypothetical protein